VFPFSDFVFSPLCSDVNGVVPAYFPDDKPEMMLVHLWRVLIRSRYIGPGLRQGIPERNW
jgi:hypothetical protein